MPPKKRILEYWYVNLVIKLLWFVCDIYFWFFFPGWWTVLSDPFILIREFPFGVLASSLYFFVHTLKFIFEYLPMVILGWINDYRRDQLHYHLRQTIERLRSDMLRESALIRQGEIDIVIREVVSVRRSHYDVTVEFLCSMIRGNLPEEEEKKHAPELDLHRHIWINRRRPIVQGNDEFVMKPSFDSMTQSITPVVSGCNSRPSRSSSSGYHIDRSVSLRSISFPTGSDSQPPSPRSSSISWSAYLSSCERSTSSYCSQEKAENDTRDERKEQAARPIHSVDELLIEEVN